MDVSDSIINIFVLLFSRWTACVVLDFDSVLLIHSSIGKRKGLYHPGCLPLTKLVISQLSLPEEQRSHSFECSSSFRFDSSRGNFQFR